MTMNIQKIIEGAQNMVERRSREIAQASAGTNLRLRVNAHQNYLTNLRKLQTYLYGGRSNVPNVPGFERAQLNAKIRTTENGFVSALDQYLNQMSRNANASHAAAGTNMIRRVNARQKYLINLKILKMSLYKDRRNAHVFERSRLNGNIRTAENGLTMALYRYLNQLSRNAVQASRDLYEKHMTNVPNLNNAGTIASQQIRSQHELRGYRIALKHIQNEIQREPMLAQVSRIQRAIWGLKTHIRQFEQQNRNFNKGRKVLLKTKRELLRPT